jgi:hypothetical protein
MKLGKEEIQKLVLGVLLFFGLVYSYFDLLLGPLMRRAETTRQSVAALGPEIVNAKAQIDKTNAAEQNAIQATMTMHQVEAMIPEGSPVAWFPTRMAEFFKKEGVDKVSTRMTAEVVDKSLPGFRRMSWGVDLPRVEFVPFCKSISTLENEEPLLEISALQIDATRDDVETQHAFLTVNNLVKQ